MVVAAAGPPEGKVVWEMGRRVKEPFDFLLFFSFAKSIPLAMEIGFTQKLLLGINSLEKFTFAMMGRVRLHCRLDK